MTVDCIVCLGGLRVANEVKDGDSSSCSDEHTAIQTVTSTTNESKAIEDDEIIAHLLPCGHNMHDSCLRPWVERANSCPICRAQFNSVELRKYLDTPAYSSYVVQDKQQQADLDPTIIIDDEDSENLASLDEPCLVCGTINNEYETMYCDGCDDTVHVFCAGFVQSPDIWYCESCSRRLDGPGHANHLAGSRTHATLPRQTRRRRGRRAGVSDWDRVWQQVWTRLNLDLDFPYDEDVAEPRRARTQRQEQAWQQRLQVANRMGNGNRFRDTANTLLHQTPNPESREEIQAWNAFDRARNIEDNERPSSRRKRKSITTSPTSPRDSDPAPERKLKRPRTRRNQVGVQAGPSTIRPVQPAMEQPSFLTSLLQEVEKQPAPSDRSTPEDENSADDQQSYLLSPASSPLHSGQVSPRALSVTPPPQTHPRPSSPMPLTSIVRPRLSSPPLARFSPAASDAERGRKRARPPPRPASPDQPSSPTSPSSPGRNMSYSTKTEIQRMVKAVLGPRYRTEEINKDQYTDINRDISRLMYDKIGGAEGLANQEERDKWQKFASDEVERAVETIRAAQQHDEVTKDAS